MQITKINNYKENLIKEIKKLSVKDIKKISNLFLKISKNNKQILICGNGGSAANSEHISNDLMLGLNKKKIGLRILSLSSNFSKISCIANDINYSEIYSHQVKTIGNKGDLLIVLSGSGNSINIIKALNVAKKKKIKTLALLGFDGGIARKKCDYFVHFNINDMQIAEDMQMITMNMVMKYISTIING